MPGSSFRASSTPKSAFLQADRIDDEVRTFAIPNADIRKRWARMINLKDDEILRILKPAFGDVRAPRQWYGTADRVPAGELSFLPHQLSTRESTEKDDPFRIFNKKGAAMVVDGVIGMWTTSWVEKRTSIIYKKEGANGEMPTEPQCFRDHVQGLFKRFKFGSIDFSYEQVFCGVHLEQSLKHDVVTVSLKHYIHHMKPVTVDKIRKQLPDEPLLESNEVTAGSFGLAFASACRCSRLQCHCCKPAWRIARSRTSWLLSFWALILWPLEDPLSEHLNKASGTFKIRDAKSLYDAANS